MPALGPGAYGFRMRQYGRGGGAGNGAGSPARRREAGRRRQEPRGTGALEDVIVSSQSGACCVGVSGQDEHRCAGRG